MLRFRVSKRGTENRLCKGLQDISCPRLASCTVGHITGTVAEVTEDGMYGAGVTPQARMLPMQVLEPCSGHVSVISGANVWSFGGCVRPRPGAVTGGCDEPVRSRGRS